MARMRRRFADRNEGIMHPNLRRPAVGNTAGRRPPEFTQTGEGSWKMNQLRPTGKHIEDHTAGRMRWNPYPEMREHMVGQNKGIMNAFKNLYGKAKSGLANEFFGGAKAAEINPKRVLASKWAQTPIDWEDIEGGMMSPIGYEDAWKALQDIDPNTGKAAGTNYDINTWGDLYGLLQPGSSVPGVPGKVLEKGLGSFSSELGETGMFPKSWSPFQVEPTVKTGKGFRNYFDVDEGALESGVYPNLQQQNWLY